MFTETRCPLNSIYMKTHCNQGFPGASADKEPACNEGDLGSIPGLGRSPGEGKGYSLQYSGLQNSMNYTHGVAKSLTRLSDFHFHFSLSHINYVAKHLKQNEDSVIINCYYYVSQSPHFPNEEL